MQVYATLNVPIITPATKVIHTGVETGAGFWTIDGSIGFLFVVVFLFLGAIKYKTMIRYQTS